MIKSAIRGLISDFSEDDSDLLNDVMNFNKDIHDLVKTI